MTCAPVGRLLVTDPRRGQDAEVARDREPADSADLPTAGGRSPSIVSVDDCVARRQEGGVHLVVHALVELEGPFRSITAPERRYASDVDAEAGAGPASWGPARGCGT